MWHWELNMNGIRISVSVSTKNLIRTTYREGVRGRRHCCYHDCVNGNVVRSEIVTFGRKVIILYNLCTSVILCTGRNRTQHRWRKNNNEWIVKTARKFCHRPISAETVQSQQTLGPTMHEVVWLLHVQIWLSFGIGTWWPNTITMMYIIFARGQNRQHSRSCFAQIITVILVLK